MSTTTLRYHFWRFFSRICVGAIQFGPKNNAKFPVNSLLSRERRARRVVRSLPTPPTISDKPADDLCAAQKGEVGVGVDQRTTDIMCSGLWNEKGQPIAIAMPCEAYRPKPIQRDQPCAKATRHNINGKSKPTTLAAAKEIPVSGAIPMRFSPMRTPAEKTVWAT